jgi:hypothetical protein
MDKTKQVMQIGILPEVKKMNENVKLLPLTKVGGKDILVDVEHREFRDFDNPDTVIKMHSPVGRQILSEMQGTDWNSMAISTGRQGRLEV